MQLADHAALAVAVDSADRKIRWQLLVDWNRNGQFNHELSDMSSYIDTANLDRSLSSDLPQEVGLLQGLASAQLTVSLTGRYAGLSMAQLLSPYREDSPLHGIPLTGCEVRLDLGMMTADGEVLVRQFAGDIRDVTVDRGTGTAQLDVLDFSERFRRPMTLGLGSMDRRMRRRYRPERYPFEQNSQVVVDQIARANGFYASTPTHKDARFSMTCHGGFCAEVGETRAPSGQVGAYTGPYWKPGPYGMLAPTGTWDQAAVIPALATEHFHCWAGSGISMSAWIYWPGGTPGNSTYVDVVTSFLAENVYVILNVTREGVFRPVLVVDNTEYSGPWMDLTPGWHLVGGYWRFHDSDSDFGDVSIHGFLDGTGVYATYTYDDYGPLPPIGDDRWDRTVFIQYVTGVSATNIQMWLTFNDPAARGDWPPFEYTPTASISAGLNDLTHIPDIVYEDSWNLLQQVVAAEYGLCGFDEYGQFFFRNRDEANADTEVRKEITSERSLKDLAVTTSADGVRNVVSWSTQEAYIGPYGTIWEPADAAELDCPPGETLITIYLSERTFTALDDQIPAVSVDTWNQTDELRFGAAFVAVDRDDNSVVIDPESNDVRVWFDETAPREGEMLVVNDTGGWVRFALPSSDAATESSSPAMRIGGYTLTAEPERVGTVDSNSSVEQFGPRTLDLGGNEWRQIAGSVTRIAQSLLAETRKPRPVMSDIPVVGDPRTQLGDRVLVADRGGIGVIPGHIVKIRRSLARSRGFEDTYAIRAITD
jgi:hypothetical protein